MKMMLFEEFENKRKKKVRSKTEDFEPPQYVVEPAKGDKGFFMFKKAFERMKKKFDTGFWSS